MTQRPPTDASEFMRFHLLLTKNAPDGYEPHYIRVNAGDAVGENGEPTGKKSSGKHTKITVAAAVRRIERGLNVGIAARETDELVIIDVDDPDMVRPAELKPTLTAMSRSRNGYHYFYFSGNMTDKRLMSNTKISKVGEIRVDNWYTLAPGSWVDTADISGEIPSEQIKNAGKYTIESDNVTAHITFEELPKAFRDHIEATQVTNAEADKITTPRHEKRAARQKSADKTGSALFTLQMGDVIHIPNGDSSARFVNPLHRGGKKPTAGISANGLLQCYSHGVSHTPLSALAVLAGVADCESAGQGHRSSSVGASTVNMADGGTFWKIWRYAMLNGLLPKDDPIKWSALVWYAIDHGVVSAGGLVDGYRLPPGDTARVKAMIKSNDGIEILNIEENLSGMTGGSDRVAHVPDGGTVHKSPEDDKIVAEARDILKSGNPIEYVLDAFNRIHIGDRPTGEVLVLSFGTTCIENCAGAHPSLSGESGKGKSHSCKTMIHLMPREFVLNTSLSEKAVFYHGESMGDGMIIFSDDIDISPGLESIVKRSTSEFQQGIEHHTVGVDRKGQTLYMPKRIVWWLASVDNEFDMQTLNRQINVSVDNSPETDRLVREQQLRISGTGEPEYPETFEVQVCREIFRTVKKLFVRVVIPFHARIEWRGEKNRRNLPMFLDMIKVYALFNYQQREQREPAGGKREILATEDDFRNAARIYISRAEVQTNKLTDNEMKIIDFIASFGMAVGVNQISYATRLDYQTTLRLLSGRADRAGGGLLSKVKELQVDDVTREDCDGGRARSKEFRLVEYDRLSSYGNIVSLREK